MTETSATATKPPQLRAARVRKQSIIKFVILFVTLAFLFVPLLAMLIFTLRHPLSGRWSAAPWIAIFTGDGESLGADLTVLWQGIGTSLALSAVTVVIMLVLLVPIMVIVHIRSKALERAIEWVATLPLTIPAIVLVVGLGPIYRWLSADVLSTNPIWLCFAYVILVMPFAFRAIAVGLNSIDVKTLVEASAVDAAPASPAIPAAVSSTAEDAFKNDPTATLEGVRGKDVTKAAKALLKDSAKRGGGSIQMRDVVKIYPGSSARARRLQPGHQARRNGRAARRLRLRQVHCAALARRPGRHRRAGQQARNGHGVPGVLAFPAHDRP